MQAGSEIDAQDITVMSVYPLSTWESCILKG